MGTVRPTLGFNALVWLDAAILGVLVLIPQCEQQRVFGRCMLAWIQLCVLCKESYGWKKGSFFAVFAETPLNWHCFKATKTYKHTYAEQMRQAYICPAVSSILHYVPIPPGRMISASRLDVCTSIWPWKICVRLHAFVSWIGPRAHHPL